MARTRKNLVSKLKYENLEARKLLASDLAGLFWTDFGTYLERNNDFDSQEVKPFEELSSNVQALLNASSSIDLSHPEARNATSWFVGGNESHFFDSNIQPLENVDSIEASNVGDLMVLRFSDAEADTGFQYLSELKDLGFINYFYPDIGEITTNSAPNDPLYDLQWHLHGSYPGYSSTFTNVNVETVWDSFTGSGVTVGVIDSGLDGLHPDLIGNYSAVNSYDFADDDSNPSEVGNDNHGTAVAGVIGLQQDNAEGGSGVAPDATLAGLRVPFGVANVSASFAGALGHQSQAIDIYNSSWGPTLSSLDAPLVVNSTAYASYVSQIENGIQSGRGGLGSIHVFAAGNDHTLGGEEGQLTTYIPTADSRYTIAVGAVARNSEPSWYSNHGASLLVSAPSSGNGFRVVTADPSGAAGEDPGGQDWGDTSGNYRGRNDINIGSIADCEYPDVRDGCGFGGTSSAAPVVSGVVALMLEANPNLTWLDVQSILVESAVTVNPGHESWTQNGAGDDVSMAYGFGLVDATAAVELAEVWIPVGEEQSHYVLHDDGFTLGGVIPDAGNGQFGKSFNFDDASDVIGTVTSVEVKLGITHDRRGDLEVKLISPSGTESILAYQRDGSIEDYNSQLFTTVMNWGESPEGNWALHIEDKRGGERGQVHWASVELFGVGDLDDHGNSAAEATELGTLPSSVQTIDGDIEFHIDEDWFEFQAYTGGQYELSAQPQNSLDLSLTLYDSDGQEVQFVDNASDSGPASLLWEAPTTGTFYVAVESAPNETGQYSFSYRTANVDDHGNDAATATNIDSLPSSTPGFRANYQDSDWFSFDADSGERYGFEAGHDAVLTLYNSDGASLDTSLGSFRARLEWIAPESGTFFVRLTGTPGEYTLEAIDDFFGDDDHGDRKETATPVSVPVHLEAEIGELLDADWFTFEADAGTTFSFNARSFDDEAPYIELRDANENVIESNYNNIDYENGSYFGEVWIFDWEAPSTGTYYISTGFIHLDPAFDPFLFNDGVGPYSLTIQTDQPEVSAIVLGDGADQRSTVDSLQVSFDSLVDFNGDDPLSALFLFRKEDNSEVELQINNIDESSGVTVLNLVFAGDMTRGLGSLLDGNYQLFVDGDDYFYRESGIPGRDFDFGRNETDDFYAQYGDSNGDRVVNVLDLLAFRNVYNNPATYDLANDHNGDGTINVLDLLQFRSRFGSSV